MKRTFIVATSAASIAVVLACTGLPTAQAGQAAKAAKAAKAARVSGDLAASSPDATFTPASRSAAMAQARAQSASIASRFGFSTATGLHVRDVERDGDGTLHIRYDRTLGGLKVLGGDFVVHQRPSGAIAGADFAASGPLVLRTDGPTKVNSARAALIASGGHLGKTAAHAQKVVWAVSGVPRLAYLSHVSGIDKQGFVTKTSVVVDAMSGKLIQTWSDNETARGSGRSLYSGRVSFNTDRSHRTFQIKDNSRGKTLTVDVHNKQDPRRGFLKGSVFTDSDNHWGNGTSRNRQSAATDVAFGVGKTWDYYLRTFNRHGIANNGRGTRSRVHYARNFDNAFWNDSCFCMTFGDGGNLFKPVVALDVAAHEMSHGITSRTAKLNYFGDSGGLNESNSDIFGTSVEFFTHAKTDPGNYFIGEQIMKPGQGPYLRNMAKPSADGASFNCWVGQMGLFDPHFTSGPGNHWFYLLAEGSGRKTINHVKYNSPVCPHAAAVQGIGRVKAAAIQYRALTRYEVSTTNYIDARDATIHAAVDLYGKNSRECLQTVKAWNAVAVPSQYWSCAGAVQQGRNTFGPNPGFESGGAHWTRHGAIAITKSPRAGIPHQGKFYAVANGRKQANTATLTRSGLVVPDSATAMLHFSMLMSASSLRTNIGTVTVKIDGEQAFSINAAYANNSYIRWDVPVSQWRGQTVTMTVTSKQTGRAYFLAMLDDFAITRR